MIIDNYILTKYKEYSCKIARELAQLDKIFFRSQDITGPILK